MTTPTARHVTVVVPHGRIDLSLPVRSSIAELVPELVRIATSQGGVPSATGWVLGRLGGAPLPAGSTVASAMIRDGELLYLDPATEVPAPMVFDDAVDAIAHAAAQRPGVWRPAVARRVAGVGVALAFAGIGVGLPIAGLARPAASLAAAVLAAVLLVGAGAVARAYGDSLVGAAVAAGGLPGAAAAGGLLGAGTGATALALALAAVALYSVLGAVLVPDRGAWFTGTAVASGIGAVAASVTAGFALAPASTAAVVAVCSVAFGVLLPTIALRAGRLPLPRIPADLSAFRRDEKPTPGPEVERGTRVAEDTLTALLAALAATAALAVAVMLARSGGAWASGLGATVGLALLLRSRAYVSTAQRTSLLAGGAVALVLTGIHVGGAGGVPVRLGLAAVLALAGLFCGVHAVRARRQSPSPYWSRILDIVEFLALVALVPTAAAVLGVYAALRALGG
jgi:type VII secretion integral membrane protein EccD